MTSRSRVVLSLTRLPSGGASVIAEASTRRLSQTQAPGWAGAIAQRHAQESNRRGASHRRPMMPGGGPWCWSTSDSRAPAFATGISSEVNLFRGGSYWAKPNACVPPPRFAAGRTRLRKCGVPVPGFLTMRDKEHPLHGLQSPGQVITFSLLSQ